MALLHFTIWLSTGYIEISSSSGSKAGFAAPLCASLMHQVLISNTVSGLTLLLSTGDQHLCSKIQNRGFGNSVKSDTHCISMFINYEIKASLRLNQRILIQIRKFRINSELSLINDGGSSFSG